MGVPGFFSWLLRHYKEHKIVRHDLEKKPKVLYIDSNCLFHPQCFKVLDYYNADTKISLEKLEKKMFQRITNYIDFLINFVDPTEEVYISVDGVAPLAKISQQRKRRYRTVDDNKIKDAIKEKYGKPINNIWNNTKITPGTEFMEELHRHIVRYIKNKKATGCELKITYSSYMTPGEGEHKILDDIKSRGTLVCDGDIDDAYIIYGLDADLFFLAMASQKNNIFLLRESTELDMKRKDKKTETKTADILKDVAEELKYVSVDETMKCLNEQITHIIELKTETKLAGKSKSFTNDFIVLCYLLGNDFLPHFPSVDIKKFGLDILLDAYTDTYICLKTSLTNLKISKKSEKSKNLEVDNIFLSELLRRMSEKELEYFRDVLPEQEERTRKKRCPFYGSSSEDLYNREMWELENLNTKELRELKEKDEIKFSEVIDYKTLQDAKTRYYKHYFGHYVTPRKKLHKIKEDACANYLEGIMWVGRYYFETCPGWKWQYDYNHAPFISDVYEFYEKYRYDINTIGFKLDIPLKPCVQLVGVLPPELGLKEVPELYKKAYLEESDIIDMFPKEIELDVINKDMYWQCIPILPRLDVMRLENFLEGLENKETKLSKQEKERNRELSNFIFV